MRGVTQTCLAFLALVGGAAGLGGVQHARVSTVARRTPPIARATPAMLFDRSRRSAGIDDRKVTIQKPLGLVLQTGQGGSVYIDEIVDGSNAAELAQQGLINKGDVVVMCSATFGDSMWSTRGVGRDRVVRAINVRAGAVSLVLETPDKYSKSSKAAQAEAERVRQVRRRVARTRVHVRASVPRTTRLTRRACCALPAQARAEQVQKLQDEIISEEQGKKKGPFGLW